MMAQPLKTQISLPKGWAYQCRTDDDFAVNWCAPTLLEAFLDIGGDVATVRPMRPYAIRFLAGGEFSDLPAMRFGPCSYDAALLWVYMLGTWESGFSVRLYDLTEQTWQPVQDMDLTLATMMNLSIQLEKNPLSRRAMDRMHETRSHQSLIDALWARVSSPASTRRTPQKRTQRHPGPKQAASSPSSQLKMGV